MIVLIVLFVPGYDIRQKFRPVTIINIVFSGHRDLPLSNVQVEPVSQSVGLPTQ